VGFIWIQYSSGTLIDSACSLPATAGKNSKPDVQPRRMCACASGPCREKQRPALESGLCPVPPMYSWSDTIVWPHRRPHSKSLLQFFLDSKLRRDDRLISVFQKQLLLNDTSNLTLNWASVIFVNFIALNETVGHCRFAVIENYYWALEHRDIQTRKKKAMARSGLLIQVIYGVFVLNFYYFMD
jgi:hypothetical protein